MVIVAELNRTEVSRQKENVDRDQDQDQDQIQEHDVEDREAEIDQRQGKYGLLWRVI
jgi:hypothetical protein